MTLWQQCLQRLRELVSQSQFAQWISPLQAEENGDQIKVLAPNQYVLDGIADQFQGLIEHAVSSVTAGRVTKVTFSVGFFGEKKSVSTEKIAISEKNGNISTTSNRKSSHALNKLYTFSNFVVGKSNQLAKAAASQVAENPGKAYNPMFLYGGVGLGKTHLMQSVGNHILLTNPEAKIRYLHSEKFVSDMVRAIQKNAINEFKEFYRGCALLIDDIQFFAGKDRSQEELFHTFNYLLEGNQQIIITSDRYPKEISGIEERLRSRFGSGLTVSVEPPDLETRVAIIMSKASQYNININHDIAFYIAKRVRSNVRELEGALRRVSANAKFGEKDLCVDFVHDVLKDQFAAQDRSVSLDNIILTVSDYFNISVAEIMSKTRARNVSRPRQIAMRLCKEFTEHSLPEIGNAFGGRDHTTVLHACRQIQSIMKTNHEIFEDYMILTKSLSG